MFEAINTYIGVRPCGCVSEVFRETSGNPFTDKIKNHWMFNESLKIEKVTWNVAQQYLIEDCGHETEYEEVGLNLAQALWIEHLAINSFLDQEAELRKCDYCDEVYIFYPHGIEYYTCWNEECYTKWEVDEEKRIADEKRKAEEEREKHELERQRLRDQREGEREQKEKERLERNRVIAEEREYKIAEKRMRQRRSAKRDGVVYLMESVGYYKIGITTNIKSRAKQINKEVPVKVKVVHHFKSDYYREVERYLHQKYWSQNAEREWFELDPEQVAEIKSIADYGLDPLITT